MALTLNSEYVTSAPVPAATAMVVRDTTNGPEVLLLRRHVASGVLGGAYVFPGGKVDPTQDAIFPPWIDRSDEEIRSMLHEPDLCAPEASQLLVAAIRETFEECGLLLGLDTTDSKALTCARDELLEGRSMNQILEHFGWHLNTSLLLPWSRWVTPPRPSVMNKRFDTRFFIAKLPPNQQATLDTKEVTDAKWMTPRAALMNYWDRKIDLAAPQIISLQHLARFTSAQQMMQHAARHPPRTIRPEPFEHEGCRVSCFPGDPMHSEASPAWEGPTRLTFRDGRFEPDGGLDALLPYSNP